MQKLLLGQARPQVNNNWWNVENNDTGHIQADDLGQLVGVEKVVDEPVVEVTQAFVMTIPRYLHNDKQYKQAKEKVGHA